MMCLSRLVNQQLMLPAGSSMVPPLGVRAEHMAQAGATEGSPTLLSNAFTSISIILLKGDGASMGLHRVLLLSCLGLAGFDGLVLPEPTLPFKVTELALRFFVLLAQSLRFSLEAQLVHFFYFLVAA